MMGLGHCKYEDASLHYITSDFRVKFPMQPKSDMQDVWCHFEIIRSFLIERHLIILSLDIVKRRDVIVNYVAATSAQLGISGIRMVPNKLACLYNSNDEHLIHVLCKYAQGTRR